MCLSAFPGVPNQTPQLSESTKPGSREQVVSSWTARFGSVPSSPLPSSVLRWVLSISWCTDVCPSHYYTAAFPVTLEGTCPSAPVTHPSISVQLQWKCITVPCRTEVKSRTVISLLSFTTCKDSKYFLGIPLLQLCRKWNCSLIASNVTQLYLRSHINT